LIGRVDIDALKAIHGGRRAGQAAAADCRQSRQRSCGQIIRC
jgi:hypothetical protein